MARLLTVLCILTILFFSAESFKVLRDLRQFDNLRRNIPTYLKTAGYLKPRPVRTIPTKNSYGCPCRFKLCPIGNSCAYSVF